MPLVVKTVVGTATVLTVEPSDTIGHIKAKLKRELEFQCGIRN
jgi:hypothetical protein